MPNANTPFFGAAKSPARWVHEDYLDVTHNDYADLHPDTEPERIARGHRREVAQAWLDGLREPADISDRLDLPLSIVLRWLVVLKRIPASSIKTEWWHYDPEVRARNPKTSGRIA